VVDRSAVTDSAGFGLSPAPIPGDEDHGQDRNVLGCHLRVFVSSAGEIGGEPVVPKVLQITREYVKAGKAGMAHDKAESLFVDAMRRAKWPTYYTGMTSLSGKSRAFVPYVVWPKP
jgi:hypothetical protein